MIRRGCISLIALVALASCGDTGGEVSRAAVAPQYMGVATSLLDGDLVQFDVSIKDASHADQLDQYADCAAAQYALIRGYGFARHVRTTLTQQGGIWAADAVYTISPALPRGLRTLDAEVVVADCEANGIPTV